MFDALKLALVVLVTVPATLLTIVLGLFDRHGKSVYYINRCWSWIILKVGGVSVAVKGLEHVDSRKQYIFIGNHQSNIDIPVLVRGLPGFQLRWLAKKELLRVPFFGWAMWASKHISVDRTNRLAAVRSLRKAGERINAGISVVVFAEGTRSRDGKLLPFKRGGFVLATETKTPIVPVTINGTGARLPAGAWRVHPGAVEVVIGKPIPVEGYGLGNLRLLVAGTRAAVEEHLRRADNGSPEAQSAAGRLFYHRHLGQRST
jgi:1-acyl-sn-glycerol-3-phosphate acyltransferase